MTDFYEALDKQTFQLRSQYLMARYAKQDYISAANLLYVRNKSAGEFMLDDMPRFKIKSSRVMDACNAMSQAKAYCDEWEDAIEQAVTVSRSENLQRIRRRL